MLFGKFESNHFLLFFMGVDLESHKFFSFWAGSDMLTCCQGTFLVGALEHVFDFSIYWEFHHPN